MYTKGREITLSKELGKITPYLREKECLILKVAITWLAFLQHALLQKKLKVLLLHYGVLYCQVWSFIKKACGHVL